MHKADKQKRNRIVALSFVSVLLLLMYGPLSQWFIGADRVLYDQLAGGRPAMPLANAYIVSIDPQRADAGEIVDRYGEVLEKLQRSNVGRIVLSNPPSIPATEDLPAWAAMLTSGT